jgi:predicted nucleic acid-binding protein
MKAGFLLDVNVLVAMAWPTHRDLEKVLEWLAYHAREGWATCPLTQTSFVRILSNPGFSAKCNHPDGCVHPAPSQPRTSGAPILGR